jgi:hypothetical protein
MAMRLCGILSNVCFIASGVVATFCSRMIFPGFLQNAAARPVIAEVQTKGELVPFENHASIYPNGSCCGHGFSHASVPLAQRDETGATALHYATLGGHREIVQLLLDNGAEINKADGQFGATPTGWAIEYLRERGGFLAIELDDLAYAIEHGDAKWVARFLKRFPTLRQCIDTKGKPFRQLAQESGNLEIMALFRNT